MCTPKPQGDLRLKWPAKEKKTFDLRLFVANPSLALVLGVFLIEAYDQRCVCVREIMEQQLSNVSYAHW